MKTVSDLLRDADPLAAEPARNGRERSLARQAILDAPRAPVPSRRRPMTVVAVVALMLLAIAAGLHYWPGTAPDPVAVAAVRFELRLAETSPGVGLREAIIAGTTEKVYLHEDAVVTNGDIARAQVVPGEQPSTFSVFVVFKPEGAAKMLRATTAHLGKRLAILIDGEVVSAPVVRSPTSESAKLTGTLTKAEADRIVAGIVGR